MSVWGLAYSTIPTMDLQAANVDCSFVLLLFGAIAIVYLMAGCHPRGAKLEPWDGAQQG